MNRSDARIGRIAELDLFRGCTTHELTRMRSLFSEIDVEADRTLIVEGAVAREFFIALEGTALVQRGGEPVAQVGRGEFFGEIAMLDGGPRTATVVTREAMRLLVAGRQEFDTMVSEPRITRRIASVMAGRLRPSATD